MRDCFLHSKNVASKQKAEIKLEIRALKMAASKMVSIFDYSADLKHLDQSKRNQRSSGPVQ